MITATRYHDISAGHRVVGQGGHCENLHGHNYRIHFTVQAEKLDNVGRVIDFGVIKSILCDWLERLWDHRFLIWQKDPWAAKITAIDCNAVYVPFNPTAENMAEYLVENVGPAILPDGVKLVSVCIEETRKCSATYTLEKHNDILQKISHS